MRVFTLPSIAALTQSLADHYELFQVQESPSGDFHWQAVAEGEQAPLLDQQPLSSAKALFFGDRENIFSFDGSCYRETLPQVKPFALLGVHSCDLTAIAYQDQFFAQDPYYQARRKQALLVGLDCLSPCEQGFCPTVDAGPGVSSTCADLILHPQALQWLLLVCSERGAELVDTMGLSLADDSALAQRQTNIERCKQSFPDLSHIEAGIDRLLNNPPANDFWDSVGIQCLSCSGCTSLCPTCSCFGTRELTDQEGHTSQQRFWDSCLYEAFQREASQHNPGAEAGARVKRFWTHKFSNTTRSEYDRHGCVGCGRCDQTCPGVIGAHAMMKRLVNTGSNGDTVC